MVLETVRRMIEEYHLLRSGETVVVGVSGGPDSLCLLHVLRRLQGEYGAGLHVAHLHHGLRGAEADADARFVEELATEWRIGCTVERADVAELARTQHLALEEAARRVRYAFLSRVAREAGSLTVAVGHNADDQAETVLMHWLRGSGLAGLRGMLPLTRLGDYRLLEGDAVVQEATSDFRLIRPLLEIPRAEILGYCSAHGLPPRFDRSNLDTTYFRNWLRAEVLPLLATHNPNIQAVIRRSARVVADDYALLRSLLKDAWPQVVLEETEQSIVFGLGAWRDLPSSLQRSSLREAIHRLRRSLRNISFVHVEDALLVARGGVTGQQATLPQGLMLTVGYDRLVVATLSAPKELPDWPLLPAGTGRVPVAVPGATALPASGWTLWVELVTKGDLPAGWEQNPDPWLAFLDAQAAGPVLWLRTRLAGDRIRPMGMKGHTAKLSDYLTNQKAPRAARDRMPLVVGERGIVWVCGLRIDERFRVREDSQQVIVLRFAR